LWWWVDNILGVQASGTIALYAVPLISTSTVIFVLRLAPLCFD
jgi:hypothetical protein